MRRRAARAAAIAGLLAGCAAFGPPAAASVRLTHPLPGLSGVSTAAPLDAVVFDYGLFASRDTTCASNRRLRVAGPFYESQTGPTGMTYRALHPLYSRTEDPAAGRANMDILWPLAQAKDLDDQRFWRFLLVYGNDFDTSGETGRYRTVIFPLAAYGRDSEGERYGAVFPLGGEVHEFLGQDRIAFVLFPCYVETEVNSVKGRAILWPIIAWAEGDRVHRFRVFPLYGKSVRDGQWQKRFVLWPFWTDVRYDYPNETGGGFVLFPVVGHIETERQNTWMVVPPFFRYSRADPDVTELRCPWPFVQYGKRPDKSYLHLWPLWGRTETKEASRSYALWPIFWRRTSEEPGQRFSSFYALPFVYSQTRTAVEHGDTPGREPVEPRGDEEANARDGEVVSRYWKVWPLMSYRREGDARRFRALELWPAKYTRGIEQNWAPLWTLYRQEAVGGASEQELLWGVFRRSRTADGKTHTSIFPLFSRDGSDDDSTGGWSILGGLLGSRREGLDKEFRVLYFLKFRSGEGAEGEPAPATGTDGPP